MTDAIARARALLKAETAKADDDDCKRNCPGGQCEKWDCTWWKEGEPAQRQAVAEIAQLGFTPATLVVAITLAEVLHEKSVAEHHVVFCEACDAGALNFCMAGQELLNAAARKDVEAIADWEKLFSEVPK